MAGTQPTDIQLSVSVEEVQSAFELFAEDQKKDVQHHNHSTQRQQQQTNNNDDDDDEWPSQSYDMKFDYYEGNDIEYRDTVHRDDENDKDTENKEEKKQEHEHYEMEDIIKNVSICLGFLLHENSPLWKDKNRHHSTIELLGKDLQKKKKSELKFSDRCSIFQSRYVLGVEREEENASPTTVKPATSRKVFLSAIQKGGKERLFDKIISTLDENEYKPKWDEFIKYWDSWQQNRNIKMEEFNDIQRFEWDKYQNDINNVSKTIDTLLESLKKYDRNETERETKKDEERLEALNNVSKREDMRLWLKQYKKHSDSERDIEFTSTIIDSSSILYKSITGFDLDDDIDLKYDISVNNLPFKKWKWQHVVFWIEKLADHQFFASVFREWEINGAELLQMNEKQIIWLTQCCYSAETVNKEIVKDLIIQVNKTVISTIITYQYGLYYKQIKKHPDISELLDYLNPKKEQGPKALWKLDAFYFSKIDNMLAMLVAPKGCRHLFREWNPKFIFDDEDTHTSDLTRLGTRGKTQKTLKDRTQLAQPQQLRSHSDDDVDEEEKSDIVADHEDKKPHVLPTSVRYIDVIDKLVNIPCCEHSACGTYIRNFDRVYLKVICLFICVLSFGCLFAWLWMSGRSRMEVGISMEWAAQSIVQRATQSMEYAFFIPQMVLNIAVGGLSSGDISVNPNDYINNTQFDEFFVQYKHYKASENTIYSLCMYEAQNNSMICSRSNGTDLWIYTYGNQCDRGWLYDPVTKQRDINNIVWDSCNGDDAYDPTTRAWYAKAQQLEVDDIGWTEPYIFAVTNDIGITLVRKVNYNGIEVIFLAEFTTYELDIIFDAIGSVTTAVTYLATSAGSVIASSTHEYDIINCTDCSVGNNKILTDSIKLLRAKANSEGQGISDAYINGSMLTETDFTLTLHSFKTTYLSGNNFEYATIAVVYDDEHLFAIQTAESVTLTLYLVALLLALSVLCGMAAYLQYLQHRMKYDYDPTGIQIRQESVRLDVIADMTDADDASPEAQRDLAREKEKAYLSTKYDSYLISSDCVFDHRTITICSFWYMLVVFLLTFFIWQKNVDSVLDDVGETFLVQEFMIIEDKVVNIVAVAESIADIVLDRFDRGDVALKYVQNIPTELDVFFANIMQNFKLPNGDFYAHMVYIGTPDGKLIGCRRETEDVNIAKYGNALRITVRDNSTDWKYLHFAANSDTLQRESVSSPITNTDSYDPRCRPWYSSTVSYMVDDDIWNAFGGDNNFINFYSDDSNLLSPARESQNCIDALIYYQDIWNVTQEELDAIIHNNLTSDISSVSLKPNEIYADKVEANDISYDMVWSQYLFASGQLGLTATKPIIEKSTGELLAVMAIDFTLEGLSDYLNTTNNVIEGEDSWFSWIFAGDEESGGKHEMIASSDHQITIPLDEIDGCLLAAGTSSSDVIQYSAIEHPNKTIQIISKEIVQFYLADDGLPINATTAPQHIKLPIDLPEALSGRFLTYPYSNESRQVSLNWILTKSISIRNFETKENDDVKIVSFTLFCLIFSVYVIQSNLAISTVKADDHKKSAIDEQQEIISQDASSVNINKNTINVNVKEEQKRANDKYAELLTEMCNIVEGSSAEIWHLFLETFKAKIGVFPMSTSIVRDFMAKESNKHIATDEDENNMLILCALQVENKWFLFKTLKFIKSYSWNTFVTILIFFHLSFSIYLPETPSKLRELGFQQTGAQLSIGLTLLAILIEIIDVILHGVSRYIVFGKVKRESLLSLIKLKHGFEHHYVGQIKNKSALWLTFFGTAHWRLFLIHIALVTLIFVNIITMISIKTAIFEYYLPLVPILLVVRSEDVRTFSYQLFYAVYLAKDVLFSYFILVLIVAIFALSTFSEILNPNQSTDTYNSSVRALITTFVFVSTGENYNDVVYSAIGNDNESELWFVDMAGTLAMINLLFFVSVSIIGLYFFIPVMIHKFELAFSQSKAAISDKNLKTKINSIIAAFIMLDMNDDGDISIDEFQHLIHSSIISRDVLFDAFANASGDEDNKISLYEFTSTLTNRNAFAAAINGIKCQVNKIQSMLECNWYRRRKNRYYVLVYVLIPSVCVALLRGLSGLDVTFLNGLVHLFFVLNFLDINLRWYAYGRKRYLSLIKYENPPFIQQAIFNWRVNRDMTDYIDDNIIDLSNKSRKWCNYYLRPVKPLSSWDKMTLGTMHRFELYVIWSGTLGFIATFIFPSSLKGYYYLFIQCYLFRLFTLIEANQRLIVLIFTIIPHFLDLLAFLFIFIFIWARIGCTIFAYKTDYVLDSIYSTDANANFNTLGSAILTLMQLMVGEGWNEIMYLNMIATRVEWSFYFILYIGFVTMIISNIFIGLFLAEIEGLDNKQSESQLFNQWMESHYNFKQIAQQRKNKLLKKLKEIDFMQNDLQKQIKKIDKLLEKKAKKKKSKWNILNDFKEENSHTNNNE